MARDIDDNDFRKLRLNTRPSPFNIPSSPFASISHENISVTAIHSPAFERQLSDAPPRNSALSSSDLLDVDYNNEHSRDPLQESMILQESTGSITSETNAIDVQAHDPRARNTSISFSSHARLDNGMRYSIEEPLPKPSRRRTRGDSVTSNAQGQPNTPNTPASQASPRINPFTGEPAYRRTRRSDGSRLSRIDHQQLNDGNQNEVDSNNPSLTSASTVSTMDSGLNTPDTPSNSFLLSPRSGPVASPAVSPILAGEPWPMLRNSMANSVSKSRISSRIGSLRTSRRSSRMSGSTSMSPATNFLAQFGQDSIASLAPPDPDDEGQQLGLDNEYVIGRQIGSGGFSVVKELVSMSDNGTKTRKAVKIVRKILDTRELENDKHQQEIDHEVSIWRYLQHENILPLHAVYETDFATFCVMDLVESGSLFDLILRRRKSGKKGLGETMAKAYAYQLASALRYLHEDMRVVHRDVKLENCLIDMTGRDADEGGLLKLCDFGLADFISRDMAESIQSLHSDGSGSEASGEVVGTLQYTAPENLSSSRPVLQPHSDIWAFGVCLYVLLAGDLPFKHSLQSRLVELISNGTWNEEALMKASENDYDNIKELVHGCLTQDTDRRWSIADVMSCSWFDDVQDLASSVDDWQILSSDSAPKAEYQPAYE